MIAQSHSAMANANLNSQHDFAPGCEAGVGHDTIILPAGGTTTLTGVLGPTSNITIEGNGHTLDGDNSSSASFL